MKLPSVLKSAVVCAAAGLLIAPMTANAVYLSSKDNHFTSVMAPLWRVGYAHPVHGKTQNWNGFLNRLKVLKNGGAMGPVTTLTTDVWWGLTESSDNNFDWSYYKKLAGYIKYSGLQWIPILSTHKCGGNTGDDCDYNTPSYVFNAGSAEIRKMKSPNGLWSADHLSPWWNGRDAFNGYAAQDDLSSGTYNTSTNKYGVHATYGELGGTYKHIRDWYQSFADTFKGTGNCFSEYIDGAQRNYTCKELSDNIRKIYIAGLAAGEVRFPAYTPAWGWNYPDGGVRPMYSAAAKQDFEAFVHAKYSGNISTVNSTYGKSWAWGNYSVDPTNSGLNLNTSTATLAKDINEWYNGTLKRHLAKVAFISRETGVDDLGDGGYGVRLGAKLAGLHWQYTNGHHMEINAGFADKNLTTYNSLLDTFAAESLDLTFTCVEMTNESQGNGASPSFSKPKDLVWDISGKANAKGVSINGENALPMHNSQSAYSATHDALWNLGFSSFTFLRINNLVSDNWDGATNTSALDDWFSFQYVIRKPGDACHGTCNPYGAPPENPPPPETGTFTRTIVLIYGTTQSGQDMFVRGGLDHDWALANRGLSCTATNFKCSYPIQHVNTKNWTSVYKTGDNYLDWYGAESGQGVHSTKGVAMGSPAEWTTNASGYAYTVATNGFGYTPYNTYGEHYWLLDLNVDCANAVVSNDGTKWIEFKTFISNGPGWEGDAASKATGAYPKNSSGVQIASKNHWAQCGKVNVMKRNDGGAFWDQKNI